jgi:hypothetical protein
MFSIDGLLTTKGRPFGAGQCGTGRPRPSQTGTGSRIAIQDMKAFYGRHNTYLKRNHNLNIHTADLKPG